MSFSSSVILLSGEKNVPTKHSNLLAQPVSDAFDIAENIWLIIIAIFKMSIPPVHSPRILVMNKKICTLSNAS